MGEVSTTCPVVGSRPKRVMEKLVLKMALELTPSALGINWKPEAGPAFSAKSWNVWVGVADEDVLEVAVLLVLVELVGLVVAELMPELVELDALVLKELLLAVVVTDERDEDDEDDDVAMVLLLIVEEAGRDVTSETGELPAANESPMAN